MQQRTPPQTHYALSDQSLSASSRVCGGIITFKWGPDCARAARGWFAPKSYLSVTLCILGLYRFTAWELLVTTLCSICHRVNGWWRLHLEYSGRLNLYLLAMTFERKTQDAGTMTKQSEHTITRQPIFLFTFREVLIFCSTMVCHWVHALSLLCQQSCLDLVGNLRPDCLRGPVQKGRNGEQTY